MNSPTTEAYSELQAAFDHFNRALFGGELPRCLITLQREKQTYGYFSHKRFANLDGVKTDEIALNPTYFGVLPLMEVMQTLVHEMTHLWQAHFGTPGRARYHNREWGDKLESVGLMPSHTGQPGGKRSGDHMADYPIDKGRFVRACDELLTQEFKLTWYDRFPTATQVSLGQLSHIHTMALSSQAAFLAADKPEVAAALAIQTREAVVTANKSNRDKYTCQCGFNVWGKPGLRIECLVCHSEFEAE